MINKWKYLYGPVYSWRLGRSLGLDLLSQDKKICNFDCIYCQIGTSSFYTTQREIFVPTSVLLDEVATISSDIAIDFVTFSGRGEPTLAQNLGEVMQGIRSLRKNKIAVITNASLLHMDEVRKDISLADVVMAKLDAFSDDMLKRINRPAPGITFNTILHGLKAFRQEFGGKLELQLMFSRENETISEEMISNIKEICPNEVQINTPLRPSLIEPLAKEDIIHIRKCLENSLSFSGIEITSVYDQEKICVKPRDVAATLIRRGKEV